MAVFMNSLVNFRVPHFLEQLGDCRIPRSILLHGVSVLVSEEVMLPLDRHAMQQRAVRSNHEKPKFHVKEKECLGLLFKKKVRKVSYSRLLHARLRKEAMYGVTKSLL
jgi:hypothetical protein